MPEKATGARFAPETVVRAMQAHDIPALLVIQAECYPPEMQEDEATMRAHLALFPDCAYLAAYRSRLGKVGRLGALFERAEIPNCMYLHDLAIARRVRAAGLGSRLVAVASAQAVGEDLRYSALVSVHASRTFWGALGYRVVDLPDTTQRGHLASYPGQSCYMVRALPAPP